MRHVTCGFDPSAATACSKSGKLFMLWKGTVSLSQYGSDAEACGEVQYLAKISRFISREITPTLTRAYKSDEKVGTTLEVTDGCGNGGGIVCGDVGVAGFTGS